jgi:hypothetical protein
MPAPLPDGRQKPGTITVSRNVAIFGGLGVLLAAMFVSCGVGAAVTAADPSVAAGMSPRPTTTVTKTATRTVVPAPPASAPAPKPSSAPPADNRVKLPNVVNKNGAIATDALNKLGITNIQYASADPTATVVLLPANWRVVKQEPGAGKKVDPKGLVVLTMKKIS